MGPRWRRPGRRIWTSYSGCCILDFGEAGHIVWRLTYNVDPGISLLGHHLERRHRVPRMLAVAAGVSDPDFYFDSDLDFGVDFDADRL